MAKKVLKEKNRKCIFIGGKQIGVNCLKQLLALNVIPELVIPNLDDKSIDTWHESTLKLAKKERLKFVQGKRIQDPQIVSRIKAVHPEIIFCIGGTQIIPKEVLNIPKQGCLNIHPALLPKYRGRYSTAHAIFNGEKYTGVTIHWMDAGIDSGPVIMQKKIKILKSDTAKSLYGKFTKVGEELFIRFLKNWINDKEIISTLQNNKIATYYPQMLPNSGQINWNWNGEKIFDYIRAMTFEPFPPVTFKIGHKEMVIVDKKYFKGFKQ